MIGITQFPSTLNPNIDSMVAKSYVLGMTQRPFTAYDHDWELACFLCTGLPTFENGLAVREPLPEGVEGHGEREGVALTYTIQPGATWGDGTPVTTDDVLFTYEVGKHPDSGISNAELYRRILGIDVVDERTFVVHADRITFDYNGLGDFRVLPAHLEREVFEADPATYRNRTIFDTDPTNPGLWFGPYRVSEVSSGSHIALEANPTWWGSEPHFKRIVVKVIENTAALEANLLSGAIDMIAGELGLTLDQALAFEQRNGDRFRVHYQPGLLYEHVDVNLDNPILADLRVRKALMLGLDRQAMSEQLFQGRQPVADTKVSELDWVYNDDVTRYSEDLEAAGALLDEAGWTRDQERHPPQRRWRAAPARADDHRRQPHARAGRAGAAEPVAPARHRRPDQERAGARLLRPDAGRAPLHGPCHVRLVERARACAADDHALGGDPDRGERAGRGRTTPATSTRRSTS